MTGPAPMQRQDSMDHLALMVDDITLALRPYGIDPADAAACAAALRAIANALSPKEPRIHRAARTIVPLISPSERPSLDRPCATD